jgi:hypothetical protein
MNGRTQAGATASVQLLDKLPGDPLLAALEDFTVEKPEAAEDSEPAVAFARAVAAAYSHSALVDLAIANPTWKDEQFAAHFGRDVGWFHAIIASDAFQQCLDERRNQVPDPRFSGTLEERVRGVILHSIAVLSKKLQSAKVDEMTAVKAIESGSKALGTIQKITNLKEGGSEVKRTLAERAAELVLGLQQKRVQPDAGSDDSVLDVETREVG